MNKRAVLTLENVFLGADGVVRSPVHANNKFVGTIVPFFCFICLDPGSGRKIPAIFWCFPPET